MVSHPEFSLTKELPAFTYKTSMTRVAPVLPSSEVCGSSRPAGE